MWCQAGQWDYSGYHQWCHDRSDSTHDPPLQLRVLGPDPHISAHSARHVRSNYSRRLHACAGNPAGTNPTRCPRVLGIPLGRFQTDVQPHSWIADMSVISTGISIVMSNIWAATAEQLMHWMLFV